ncbi:hypothetical protein FB563_6273 [Streptomyces puniciscabiei]|uniref:Uncharacterized protein n=1 Tax=Streptomyces puniciscabiei TaxID=164348 RepID=A0A542TH77_9ACTN|nr:hypothetical protein [Streptomyces puniciscabiei]TQK86176.1 hypothetical protein FB563_6273 [Streptomyces puniciscabiei]
MLIPYREPDVEETMLPPDHQRILAAVWQAAGPVALMDLIPIVGSTSAGVFVSLVAVGLFGSGACLVVGGHAARAPG